MKICKFDIIIKKVKHILVKEVKLASSLKSKFTLYDNKEELIIFILLNKVRNLNKLFK